MRRILLLVLATLSATFVLAAFVRAPEHTLAGTLDQSFTGIGLVQIIGSGKDQAQTFTAGVTGNLDRVDVDIFKGGAVGTNQPTQGLTLTIRTTSSGLPTSTVLATAAIPKDSVPCDEGGLNCLSPWQLRPRSQS